jgi:hypothetical protein
VYEEGQSKWVVPQTKKEGVVAVCVCVNVCECVCLCAYIGIAPEALQVLLYPLHYGNNSIFKNLNK